MNLNYKIGAFINLLGVMFTLSTISALAQDIAITNTRIIVGSGQVIENGTIIVRGGKIDSVVAGSANNAEGLTVIDATGMTAMPGFIDGHKHINTGPDEKGQMQSLLEAGYTTILSGGGPGDGNITLRDHINSGLINGPRVIPFMFRPHSTSTNDSPSNAIESFNPDDPVMIP